MSDDDVPKCEGEPENLAGPRVRPWLFPLLIIVLVGFLAMAVLPAALAYLGHVRHPIRVLP
jgi:hypothetical protein